MKRTPKARDAEASRRRIWEAAVSRFATSGFDGAKVDAIAADAGVNKAMLYYHFADKLALYHAILRDMFSAVAEAIEAVRAEGGSPDVQLRGYVRAVAHAAAERPHFPAIWLREVADAGRHLDPTVFADMQRVLLHLGAILQQGTSQLHWRPVDPFLVQAGIAAPMMLIFVSRSLRARAGLSPDTGRDLDALVDHFTRMTLVMLSDHPGSRS